MRFGKVYVASAALLLSCSAARGQNAIERKDVEFSNATLRLAGTLYLPQRAANAPAVVLIHGSGETDRTSLRFYAEMFAQNGIVALVYDKRGVGTSQGADHAYRRWYRTVMDVDPVPVWRALTAPALLIFGDAALDDASPVERGLASAGALKAGGRDIEVLSLAGANHSLQRNGKDVPIAEQVMAWFKQRL